MKILCLLALLSMSACVQQQQIFDAAATDRKGLMSWLEQDLSPYLTKQVSEDPRFRNQSIMLIRLDGAEVQAEIDQLTRHIRRQTMDALLDTRGIQLPWQPLAHGSKHHRRLSSVQCKQSIDANYYIGVEITPMPSGSHRISVRALDMSERQWVSGFGLNWQGKLTRDEKKALSRLSVDESLRGLRALPFTMEQTDMAADYLANNVSCLLQQQDEDRLLLHVQTSIGQSGYMTSLRKLVANNLSRYHEVGITDQAAKADYVLTLERVSVRPGVDQVWTAIRRKHTGVRLSGMDTSTYIQQPTATATAHPRFKKPLPRNPRIQNLKVGNIIGKASCAEPSGRCALLTIDALDSTDLFIIQHHAPAQLNYLSARECGAGVQALAAGSKRYQLSITPPAGETTFYALGVNRHSRKIVSSHLAGLPRSCMSPGRSLGNNEMNQWLAKLQQIMQQQQQNISWAATRTSY